MDFLKQYQADIMLILSGICGMMVIFVRLTDSMSAQRKRILSCLELSAMILMIADRRAYIFRGDTSNLGWWMVRISNFLVFFLTLVVVYLFNRYLINLLMNEGKLSKVPRRLQICGILAGIGVILVIISQFTGLYYTFDELNQYQRSPGFILSYVIPFSILLLQLSVVIQHYRKLNHSISFSLLLFTGVIITASILQVFLYGLSLNNIMIAMMAGLLYVFSLQDLNREVKLRREAEIEQFKKEQKRIHSMFEQTTEALASAIDAKDPYTHGHSSRVAMYAAQIAREAGKPEEECEKVYFAGLLHDVGKIGIRSAVINKPGRLTDEEYVEIKLHPVLGDQILKRIQESPYLSIGAHYHHERYDGKGYPEGLKGDDIPEIARIIAVADAYDAMTSKRSYRDPIPQQQVREEMVKGMGTQFDPEYAKILIHMIDLDIEYTMREHEALENGFLENRIHCESIGHECTGGILLSNKMTRIRFYCLPDEGFTRDEALPSLILFDALDGRVHDGDTKIKDLLYFEYGRFRLDGEALCKGVRKVKTDIRAAGQRTAGTASARVNSYEVEAFRIRDHALIRIISPEKTIEHIVALPDSSRFAYLSITGEHCLISNIRLQTGESAEALSIPRIAEEISYIRNLPEGDLPNLQIDGWRSHTTPGIPVTDSLSVSFHAQSLPTARLIWHCPFISLFTSENGRVEGEGFREFLLLRLDGENWESDEHAGNEVRIDHTRAFPGWNVWKEKNKEGMDCTVTICRKGNIVTMETENLGISISSVTTIIDDVRSIYVAITGDQCTVTNIRIHSEP